ncbi:carboxymuconolactone decarboxylase family protein [Actinoallomurus rhizosphaericola]|uniref:carboxymuconolactone decarboxylase family protein n=1 Tax=Actinoallomurus rhizosphaericola TaxID=2952536 RepID=UPI00209038E1|nr:carboxymuconolactone decarboxylase family protein [Actinoallomurus rhizosphaericola]MCO5993351.1 carboxymuconolactone decarboxylase family protein [Actinoallomurus rhizosphaericola]
MNEHVTNGASGLGGRLPLLSPDALDEEQRAVHARLQVTRLRSAEGAGYTAALSDGRLIGPFNVMLRHPRIARPLLEWAQAIAGSGIPADVREVVILTVAARWRAEYALYAHTAGAERAGVPETAITALRHGDTPRDLRPEADIAHRVAGALVRDHQVSDELYAEAVAVFGAEGLVALVNLIGQYLTTCALLACFQVPAPARHRTAAPTA